MNHSFHQFRSQFLSFFLYFLAEMEPIRFNFHAKFFSSYISYLNTWVFVFHLFCSDLLTMSFEFLLPMKSDNHSELGCLKAIKSFRLVFIIYDFLKILFFCFTCSLIICILNRHRFRAFTGFKNALKYS